MDLEERRHFDSLYPEHKFERRAFIVTSIGAGFALAVQPISAQTITTDSNGLIAGPVKVPVKDGEMPAYRAMPDKEGPFPMILVVHEAWAVHEHIQDICRRLAKVGYCAIAPDLFARYGDVSKMETPAIVQNVMSKVTAEQSASDLDACVAFAKTSGKANTEKLAVIGFCFGGGIVWQYAARNHALKTGVAFYGQLSRRFAPDNKSALDLAPDLTVPVLGLYGGKDQGIPLDQVEKMRTELKESGNPSQIIVYPDADHAFFADYRPSYNKAAAEDAWKKMLAWLKYYGVA
ncbi:MAG TPA: dienelactone hydrolase family protein [Casimicrobiaceae bacterium]|jgi:carboxymethylenebutenolidase|nr:dienelactone hydrolase family protein [Casimicrobiaceae bacterium]